MTQLIEGLEGTNVKERLENRVEHFNNSVNRVKEADGVIMKTAMSVPVAWNGLRVVTGGITTPLVFGLEHLGKILPTVGKIIVQPLQVPAFLLSKAVSTKSKYNGKVITNLGENIGEILGGLSQVTSKGLSAI